MSLANVAVLSPAVIAAIIIVGMIGMCVAGYYAWSRSRRPLPTDTEGQKHPNVDQVSWEDVQPTLKETTRTSIDTDNVLAEIRRSRMSLGNSGAVRKSTHLREASPSADFISKERSREEMSTSSESLHHTKLPNPFPEDISSD